MFQFFMSKVDLFTKIVQLYSIILAYLYCYQYVMLICNGQMLLNALVIDGEPLGIFRNGSSLNSLASTQTNKIHVLFVSGWGGHVEGRGHVMSQSF